MRRILPGVGAVLLVAAGHIFIDLKHGGIPLTGSLPSTVALIAELGVLSWVHRWAVRRRIARTALMLLEATVAAACGQLIVAFHFRPSWPTALSIRVGVGVGLAVAVFWALVFLLPVVLEDARLRTLEAESLRREAELARLRASLQPHFLLNTLNAIAGLVVSEPREARHLLVALGDLLRDSLDEGPEIRAFEQDAAWLQRYAEILEIRHGGSLKFTWDLEPSTLGLMLPRLLLQPLLENAVKHGALLRREGGVVGVRSRATDRAIQFVIEDNGPGIVPKQPKGLGIHLVRERLRVAYPGASFQIQSLEGITRATIEIPRAELGS